MSQLNAATLQVVDICDAFDLIRAKTGDDQIGNQKATELLQDKLTQIGYAKANSTNAFAKTRIQAIENGKVKMTTVETASANAKALYEAVTGNAANDDAPAARVTTDTQAEGTAEAESQPEAGGRLIPVIIDMLPGANASAKSAIGSTMANASGGKFKNVEALIRAFGKADDRINQANSAIETANGKLTLMQDGKFDEADAIEVPALDPFQSSGLSAVKFQAQDLGIMNAFFEMMHPGATFEETMTALQAIEETALKKSKALNEVRAKIRKATPKAKISAAADEGVPAYDIVMKTAAEVMAGTTFQVPGDLLDFEVPTFDWHGDVPSEVPAIDQTFRFLGGVTANALDAIAENKISWLMGDSGCGKSEFWQQLAARLGFIFVRVNLDAGITRSDLIGRTVLKPGPNGQTVSEFVEGILPRAMKQPCILMFDEFDCGDPEIMPILQPVLEGGSLRILEDGGRVVKPHPYCRIVVTANTNGLGSTNGAYNNVNEQSAATRNRFLKWMKMPYLPASEEIKVVMARQPDVDQDFVQRLVQFAEQARTAYSNNESGHVFSTRNVMEAARQHAKFLPRLKDPEATTTWVLNTTVFDACDDKSKATLSALKTTVFG